MPVLVLIVSFLITFCLVPLNVKLSCKCNVVSYPRERDAHTKPTPRMGGLSIAVSFIACMIWFIITQGVELKKSIFILIGAIFLCIIGILDDVFQLKALHKFLGQIFAISLAILGGVNIRFLVFDGNSVIANIVEFVNIFGTFFWTLGIINAINLIDGLDGLSSGVSVIASMSFMVISAITGNPLALMLSVTLAGATLGFLAHNFNPASIFMGDTGSMLLGYILAIVALEVEFEYFDIISFAAPLTILALPIFDTTYAILRRIVHRLPISEPDKNHTHHKLMRKGFGYRTTVIILYAVSILFGILGVYTSIRQSKTYIVMSIVVLVLLMIMIAEKKDTNKNVK